jgi:hypothetical protein
MLASQEGLRSMELVSWLVSWSLSANVIVVTSQKSLQYQNRLLELDIVRRFPGSTV